jgi:hypothetical protein
VFSEITDGHEFQEDMSKDALPSVANDPASGGGNHTVEGVKEAILSRVDGMDHGAQLLLQGMVKYRAKEQGVKKKNGYKIRI